MSYEGKGWIALHRSVRQRKDWYSNSGRKANEFEAWLELMFMANWKQSELEDRGECIKVRRGQVLTSISSLARRFRWTWKKTNGWLKRQERIGEMEVQRTKSRTIITLCDYNTTQFEVPTDDRTNEPTDPGNRANRIPTSKNMKKKEVKEGPESFKILERNTNETERWNMSPEQIRADLDELSRKVED